MMSAKDAGLTVLARRRLRPHLGYRRVARTRRHVTDPQGFRPTTD
ncbi:hypothetical protein [Mycobacterium sp. JS623]|nr:hypothetical protein [Mycobacterium sp. JS623]